MSNKSNLSVADGYQFLVGNNEDSPTGRAGNVRVWWPTNLHLTVLTSGFFHYRLLWNVFISPVRLSINLTIDIGSNCCINCYCNLEVSNYTYLSPCNRPVVDWAVVTKLHHTNVSQKKYYKNDFYLPKFSSTKSSSLNWLLFLLITPGWDCFQASKKCEAQHGLKVSPSSRLRCCMCWGLLIKPSSRSAV